VNLWTVGCADPRLTAQARSPMGKPGKTLCVSPTLPTGRRLSTSFTAPQQQHAFLSPELVEAILQGQQPVELTATRLTELDLPLDWTEQHRDPRLVLLCS
jgi:hypothetical protein